MTSQGEQKRSSCTRILGNVSVSSADLSSFTNKASIDPATGSASTRALTKTEEGYDGIMRLFEGLRMLYDNLFFQNSSIMFL